MVEGSQRNKEETWTVLFRFIRILGRYALRDRARGAPINHSGFVSNRSESQLQSQAQTPPEAELEQRAALILVIELSRGERRKRGLGGAR